MANFKPTLKDPMSDQSKGFEKNFKKTMIATAPDIAPSINLNETDGMLSEAEQSLKKKIFSLAKMEALVFSDPKLSAVYEEMAENGEEKYGYHYNETIQNMIFNDYVLNSPKYLQKYKMSIPKEKKRRDKSGINQLKKQGEKKMTQSGLPTLQKTEVTEGNEPVTKVMFLVNERDPEDPDLFAYFPEENHDREGKFKTAYSHIGQHSSASPDYAAESRPATPEEYADLKAELEGIGYNLEVMNELQESTSAGSAGGAAGYVGYAGPAAWGKKGDLSGDFKGNAKRGNSGKAKAMNKPISRVISIVETNYLIDSSGFEKYIQQLNEQSESDFIQNNSDAYGRVNNMSPENRKIIVGDIKTGKLDEKAKSVAQQHLFGIAHAAQKGEIPMNKLGGAAKKIAKTVSTDDVEDFANTKHKDLPEKVNENNLNTPILDLNSAEELAKKLKTEINVPYINAKVSTLGGLNRPSVMVAISIEPKENWKNGIFENSKYLRFHITYDGIIELFTKQYTIPEKFRKSRFKSIDEAFNKINTYVEKIKTISNDNLNKNMNEGTKDNLIDFDIPTWAVPALINADESGLSDEDQQKLNAFVDRVVKQFGNANFMLGDIDGEDDLGFKPTNDIDNLGNDVYRLYINPTKEQNIMTENLDARYNSDETYRFAVKSKYIIGFQGREDILYFKTKENALEYVDQEPETREYLGDNNIEEDTQTMIQNNGTSMSNKAQATGDQSSGVPVGMQATGGLQESDENKKSLNPAQDAENAEYESPSDRMYNTDAWVQAQRDAEGLDESFNILEEINKELEAFSIHHNKLKLMAEDKKSTSMILGDRLRAENPKNFKKDLQDSDTKKVIDVEKELQWKDQQTDVGTDPQKLGQDIEKTEVKTTDMKGDEALKNVGDSTNEDGDEIPKRNLTTEEQEEVNLYRNGLHSPVFDNEPGKRYEDRMKADMGDDIYEIRRKQLEFKGKAPMYNKDPQPVEDTTAKKVQFDKEQTDWNERMGIGNEKNLKESMITGRYIDALGKRRLIEFRLTESVITENGEDYFPLDFTGLGNTYNSKTVNKKVVVNETVVNAMASHKFFTDGKVVIAVKNPVQKLNENKVKEEKPVLNEQMDKMKHLLGYKPESFTNTGNVKKNRGF